MLIIDIKRIKLRGYNRDEKDDVSELAQSIKEHGLLNPIIVTPIDDDKFQLVAGERRLRACQLNGETAIGCTVIMADKLRQQQVNLVENLQRKDLSIWEEARHLEELKKLQPEARVEDLALQIGRPATWVAHRLRLGKLHPDLRELFQEQNWPISHVALLARMSHDCQGALTQEIRRLQKQGWSHNWYQGEGKSRKGVCPSLRVLREFVEDYQRALKTAPWDLDSALVDPKAGPCSTCPKRSSQEGLLFQEEGDDAGEDLCLDPVCWNGKKVAFVKLSIDKLKTDHKQKPVLIGDTYQTEKGLPKAEVSSWQVHQVKKGTPGARPAIHVSGSEMGKVVWVGKRDAETQSSRRNINQDTGKAEPPSTKQRLATILHKRQAFAVRRWMDLLETRKPSLEQILPIIAMLGTSSSSRIHDAGEWKEVEQLRQAPEGLAAKLWESCYEVLQDRCRINGPVEKQAADRWQEAVHQAQAIGEHSTLLECFREAIAEIKLTRALIAEGIEDPGMTSVEASKPRKGKGAA